MSESSFQHRFAAAEGRGGCAVVGGFDFLEERIVTIAEDLSTILDVSSGRDRCAGLKLKAASRAASQVLTCHSSAALQDGTVSGSCLDGAADGLAADFARYELRLACATTNDGDDAAELLQSFASEVAAAITGDVAGPSPSGLAAVIDVGDIDLSWTHPVPDQGLTHAKVVRRLNAAPSGPEDAQATEIFFGTGQTATDDLTALLPSTAETARTYHYAVYACTAAEQCEMAGDHTTLTPTLVQALRAGGYVLHWRHASADVCADRTDLGTAETTSVPDWWRTCDSNCGTTTARQLNATGRSESTAIGDAFAMLGIPVGRVVSSEFCRNFETAALMDFGPTVEESPLITFFVYDEANRCAHSYDMLAEVPSVGTNTALIGHAGFNCAILGNLAWAEAAIFKPDGLSTTLVTRVTAGQWLSLP
jgi:phosphohistidine phosphatase SixA